MNRSRSRQLIRKGLKHDSSWQLGLGLLLGAFGIARRATKRQPEVVTRLQLEPGEGVVIRTREPAAKPDRRTQRKRRR